MTAQQRPAPVFLTLAGSQTERPGVARNMKTFAAILFLLTANAFAIEPVIERTEDLGHGFRFVTLAESSNSKFESVGHFQYLFY